MLFSLVFDSHHSGHSPLHSRFCVPSLFLSTFNCQLLTSSKPFIIRTSETPLPQLLYNQHLRAPLGSAGNKGLITPLESALTENSPVSRLESALAERWGWGPCSPLRNSPLTARHSQPDSSSLFSNSSRLFCTRQKLNSFVFTIPPLFPKTPGGGGGGTFCWPHRDRTASVAHPFRGEASASRQAHVTTHQLQVTTYAVLPNRPRWPYHRSFGPSPAMSPPPIPGLNPVYE